MSKPDRTTARSRWVLRKLKITRARQKAWREKPDHMEAIRCSAIKQAKENKQAKEDKIKEVIATWPDSMTPAELKNLVERDLEYSKRYSSLTYRFSRRKLLAFREDGLWHNLARLPSA